MSVLDITQEAHRRAPPDAISVPDIAQHRMEHTRHQYRTSQSTYLASPSSIHYVSTARYPSSGHPMRVLSIIRYEGAGYSLAPHAMVVPDIA
eukprot:1452106-Rhodomonas_salina.1